MLTTDQIAALNDAPEAVAYLRGFAAELEDWANQLRKLDLLAADFPPSFIKLVEFIKSEFKRPRIEALADPDKQAST